YGSYSHGPILPKNPEFADHLIETSLITKYGSAELAPLDDKEELDAHDHMLDLVLKGATSKD
ncbi:MAG: glutamine amidotransferase, partial [Eubacterium sp.]|nr:glutamine amidotransferase [Eubacterium sp.]